MEKTFKSSFGDFGLDFGELDFGERAEKNPCFAEAPFGRTLEAELPLRLVDILRDFFGSTHT